MCGSFADLEEPTLCGPGVRARGRDVAAKGRDFGTGVTARVFRWRGCAGPTLVALRRRRTPSEACEDSRPPGKDAGHRVEVVGHCGGTGGSTLRASWAVALLTN